MTSWYHKMMKAVRNRDYKALEKESLKWNVYDADFMTFLGKYSDSRTYEIFFKERGNNPNWKNGYLFEKSIEHRNSDLFETMLNDSNYVTPFSQDIFFVAVFIAGSWNDLKYISKLLEHGFQGNTSSVLQNIMRGGPIAVEHFLKFPQIEIRNVDIKYAEQFIGQYSHIMTKMLKKWYGFPGDLRVHYIKNKINPSEETQSIKKLGFFD